MRKLKAMKALITKLDKILILLKTYLTQPDRPSLVPQVIVPLWKSLLIDWGIIFSLGFWYPKK